MSNFNNHSLNHYHPIFHALGKKYYLGIIHDRYLSRIKDVRRENALTSLVRFEPRVLCFIDKDGRQVYEQWYNVKVMNRHSSEIILQSLHCFVNNANKIICNEVKETTQRSCVLLTAEDFQ